jgi:hypothetical protein
VLAAVAFSAVTAHADVVSASGEGSVAVGHNSGTLNIFNGPTAEELTALLGKLSGQTKGQAKPLTRKDITQLTKLLNTAIGNAHDEGVTEAVVGQFLGTVTREQVPREKWPESFQELTRRYLEWGERLKALPTTSDEIKELVARAEKARVAGRWDEADRLLDDACQKALGEVLRKKDEAREASRQAARPPGVACQLGAVEA